MYKLFVDDIRDKAKKHLSTPSPDRYHIDTFSDQGPKFTMSAKLKHSGIKCDDRHEYYLDRQSKVPGPGTYNHIDAVGKHLNISLMKSSRVSTIPKAQDRFITVKERNVYPGPDKYSIGNKNDLL